MEDVRALLRQHLLRFERRHTPADQRETSSLPNNQQQHRTLHIHKDVLPYALC